MTIPLNLHQWAVRHQITPAALADLVQLMGIAPLPPAAHDPRDRTSESYVQSLVRLEAPRHGVWLTRNNVGVLPDKNGRPVRYGLANESPQQNKVLKSHDLIGWRSIGIEARHVGCVIAQFVSRECKKVTWSWGEDPDREAAQLAWSNLVTRAGGDARFVQGEGSFE